MTAVFFPGVSAPAIFPQEKSYEILREIPEGALRDAATRKLAGIPEMKDEKLDLPSASEHPFPEEYAGAFPMWLAPEQVRVLTIADRHYDHAKSIGDALRASGLRVDVPTTSDKLGAKIRQAQLDKVPVMLVVGDKEEEQGGAAVRLRDGTDKGTMALADLTAWLLDEAKTPDVA